VIRRQRIKVAFVVAHDAYLKGGQNICKILKQQSHFDVSWLTTSNHLATKEIAWVDINQADQVHDLVHADVIYAGLGGRALSRLIRGVKGAALSVKQKKPLIVSYFPGVLHLHIFESLVTRLRADRVLLNCERDYQLYRRVALATIGQNNGMLLGAPWIGRQPDQTADNNIDLLFIEQSIVPKSRKDRIQLVEHLAKLSVQKPDWRIVVVLRARQDQASSHQVEYCLEAIARGICEYDHRLEFSYDDVDQLMSRSKRVATISSSAAFTSLAWLLPTLFINDLGIQKAWGNDLFSRSGYMGSLHEADSYSASNGRWSMDFIQLPRPEVVATVLEIAESTDAKFIPKIRACNFSLCWIIFLFCMKNSKNPWSENLRVFRTIRNINRRTYTVKR
jgi:hypothetical protein